MAISVSPVRWAAGLGVAVAVTGAVLLPGLADAQTPPRGGTEPVSGPAVRCGVEGPAAGARPIEATDEFITAIFATSDEDFAAQLAEALGMSTAEVERAIASSRPAAPAAGAGHFTVHAAFVSNDPDVLEAVAEDLDVSVADLEAAVEAAMPDCPDGPEERGDLTVISVAVAGSGDIFATIAEELGGDITADEVREAFEAAQESIAPAVATARPAVIVDVKALAEALGITVEEIEEAMESITRRPGR